MKRSIVMMLVLALSALTVACADNKEAETRVEQPGAVQPEALLSALFPGVEFDAVTEAPIPGFYQALAGTEVVYLSHDGRYVFHGDIIDTESQANLTERVRATERLKLIKGLDTKGMIVFAPAKTKYTVTVFTDVDCNYCRKMHSQIAEYNRRGIAVRYAAFPLTGPDSPSYYKAISVWCAPNRNVALTEAKAGKPVPERKCAEQPVDQHMHVAAALGVNSTPTLVFEDGTLQAGYVSPQRLEALMAEMADHAEK